MDPIQLITLTGAAGMAIYVLNLLSSGKFHTHSEVEGLRADKVDLFKANHKLAAANEAANETLRKILEVLQAGRDEEILSLMVQIHEDLTSARTLQVENHTAMMVVLGVIRSLLEGRAEQPGE